MQTEVVTSVGPMGILRIRMGIMMGILRIMMGIMMGILHLRILIMFSHPLSPAQRAVRPARARGSPLEGPQRSR